MIGGGVGTAIAYPTAVAFHEADNRVWDRRRPHPRSVILQSEMSAVCDKLAVTTDDGSYGRGDFARGDIVTGRLR